MTRTVKCLIVIDQRLKLSLEVDRVSVVFGYGSNDFLHAKELRKWISIFFRISPSLNKKTMSPVLSRSHAKNKYIVIETLGPEGTSSDLCCRYFGKSILNTNVKM
jgi:hypothetical protein